MDGEKFDDLLKKVCTTRLTRLGALRGLAVAAVAAVTGSALVADDASAGHGHKKQARRKSRSAATCRNLGQACKPGNAPGSGVQGNCCATVAGEDSGLECQFVGETGASRCECNAAAGFIECNGTCVGPSGIGGPINCQISESACDCVCPTSLPDVCTTSGGTEVCVSRDCPEGQTFNEDTCQCAASCPAGQAFCNGCCHNISLACQGLHNKNFNAKCCSCENPGQPSGNCRGTKLTCPDPNV